MRPWDCSFCKYRGKTSVRWFYGCTRSNSHHAVVCVTDHVLHALLTLSTPSNAASGKIREEINFALFKSGSITFWLLCWWLHCCLRATGTAPVEQIKPLSWAILLYRYLERESHIPRLQQEPDVDKLCSCTIVWLISSLRRGGLSAHRDLVHTLTTTPTVSQSNDWIRQLLTILDSIRCPHPCFAHQQGTMGT